MNEMCKHVENGSVIKMQRSRALMLKYSRKKEEMFKLFELS